ncbi:MAG TPA: hypothetical protein VGF97_15910 [Rhizomicrobium sp.]|jgi:hypothetical protein
MPNQTKARPVTGRLLITACAALFVSGAAQAQSDMGSSIVNGLFGAMSGAMSRSAEANDAWKQVDMQTQSCLASRYNLNIHNLVVQGVKPDNPSVAPDVQACQNAAGGQAESQQASVPQQPAKPDRGVLVQKYGSKNADLILAGQIAKGMDSDEVTLAWGDPKAKDASTPGHEVWNYGDDVVTFTQGKVSEVGH